MLFASLLSLALLPFNLFAQDQSIIVDKFGGLDDTNPSASLPNSSSQDLLNVESTLLGNGIKSRPGFANTATLSIATAPISGSFNFIDSSGNNQTIVCQNHNCAKSTNNSAFSVFLSTAGGSCMPTRWSFVAVGGKMYGANDCRDAILQYDGTAATSPPTMPQGSVLELTKDRLVIADVATNPNGIYYSQQGTYTNFTTGVNSVDPFIDQTGSGDRTTALKYSYGSLYFFKTNSIGYCNVKDQYASSCSPISNTIGTADPASIVEIPQGIAFKGNDNNFWQIDANGLHPLSLKITNFIQSQNTGKVLSNTQTSQSDWQNGSQSPSGSYSTTIAVGSVVDSSATMTNGGTISFGSATYMANIDTTSVANIISLSSITAKDNWSTVTVPGNLGWITNNGSGFVQSTSGNYYVYSNAVAQLRISTTAVASSSGSWTWSTSMQFGGGTNECSDGGTGTTCWELRFMKKDANNYYVASIEDVATGGKNATAQLSKVVSGSKTILSNSGYTQANGNIDNWQVVVSTQGFKYFYDNGVQVASTTDTSLSGPFTSVEWMNNGFTGANNNGIGNFSFYQYYSSGTYFSRIFDTSFSTPTWGPLSSTFSVTNNNTEVQTNFYTRVSTSPNNDMWDSLIASSDTKKLTNASKRYAQYEAQLFTFISTKTPTISTVTLISATTGLYETQCINTANMSSYGIVNCGFSNQGAGLFTLSMATGTSCGAVPSITDPSRWTSQVNNAAISVGTGAVTAIRLQSLLGSATDVAQVDACTIYWVSGTNAPPTWGAYDSLKNVVYWTTAINNNSGNNRILKYDLNLDEWYPFGINANALRFINNILYFGDSAQGKWYQYGNSITDDGTAISSYWKSKDFAGSLPFQDKNFNKLSLVPKNQGSGNLTVTYGLSNGTSGNYSISLSTTSTIQYIHANYNLPKLSPQQFVNTKFSSNSPWEVDGMQIDFVAQPWKPQNP